MNVSSRALGLLIIAAALPACLFLGGCQQVRDLLAGTPHDHNLHYVACGNASIAVNANTGTSYEDSVVFLCKGQTVMWSAPSGTASFSVDFGTDSPFVSGQTSVSSQNQAIGPLQVIGAPAGTTGKAFKYKLTVGSNSFDPHVIIMGGS